MNTSQATTPIRRAVITGAAGFIGRHLTRALLQAGTTVIAVDREHPLDQFEVPIGEPTSSRLFCVRADLRDCAIEPILVDADAVFHLAGIPGVRPSWGPAFASYVDCNIHVAQRIMDASIKLGVPRVVVASSSSVYGATDGTPSTETDPTQPASPYGVTKLAQEQLCLAHARRPGSPTSVVALRYFTVYGPGQRDDMFIQRALRSATTGETLRVYGEGTQRRDFTFVDDAVTATVRAATIDATAEVFNIGAGANAALSEVIKHCEAATGATIRLAPAASRDGDVPSTHADIARARARLGWEPQTRLIDGIARQAAILERFQAAA